MERESKYLHSNISTPRRDSGNVSQSPNVNETLKPRLDMKASELPLHICVDGYVNDREGQRRKNVYT